MGNSSSNTGNNIAVNSGSTNFLYNMKGTGK